MFVAIARLPEDPARLDRLAAITGVARVDAVRMITGNLPKVIVRGTREGVRLVAELEAAGFTAFTAETTDIPTDQARVVARSLAFHPEHLEVTDTRGQVHACPVAAMAAFLRGLRQGESFESITTTERKLDLGKAILTSGLMISKKVETTTERRTATREPFLLLQRNDGQAAIMFYEHRLNYQGLGAGLQHSRATNFQALLVRLQALAPATPFDDRMLRPGFLASLPPMGVDPADLALFLITEARGRSC
jgi:hypothetical protein